MKTSTFTKKRGRYHVFALLTIALVAISSLVSTHSVYASNTDIPAWGFGVSPNAQTIHVDENRPNGNTDQPRHTSEVPRHLAPSANQSTYEEGDFIGTLHVERLNRTVRIYEGETMHNMDFGAGRFTFTGLHNGNMGLIGHNRGPAGFFSFVRLLRYGDIITIETSHGVRRYVVEMLYIIRETDFTPLQNFNDNRITLITCVEYQPSQRRVAVAMRI